MPNSLCNRIWLAAALAAAFVAAGCNDPGAARPGAAGSGARPAVAKPPASPGLAPGAAGGVAAGLISDKGAGVVGANAGSLVGGVAGPSAAQVAAKGGGLVANNGAGFVANNGAGLIANNGAGLVAPAGRQLLAAPEAFAAIAGAQVTAVDAAGRVLAGPVASDAAGRFRLVGLVPSGALIYLRASYEAGGRPLVLLAAVGAPREAGEREVAIDPATTLIAREVQGLVASGTLLADAVQPAAIQAAGARLAAAIDERLAVVAALVAPEAARAELAALGRLDAGLQATLAALALPGPGVGPGVGPDASAVPAGSATPAATASPAASAAPGPSPSPQAPGVAAIETFAGGATAGTTGDGGPSATAAFQEPFGLAFAAEGGLYVSDVAARTIRLIRADGGLVTRVAGTGATGSGGDGGPPAAATFTAPTGLALDAQGRLYVADKDAQRVRRVAGASITTVAGTGVAGSSGDDQAANLARLRAPRCVAVRGDELFVGDRDNFRIRRVALATGLITAYAGTGASGDAGDGGPAAAARFNGAYDLAIGPDGDLFVADAYNHRIRRIRAASGIIETVAGNGTQGATGDGGAATAAQLSGPAGIAFDAAGNLFIADTDNHRVRRVDRATGRIATIAGTGVAGFGGDGGPGPAAQLNSPKGLALDAAGRLYVADSQNHRVRRLALP